MEWKIRRLEARDEDALILFLGQWISDRSVTNHFRWLYRENPHGKAISWIAVLEKNGVIVACTSVFPRLMRLRGEQVLGSSGGDTFVDPNFRRRGIAQSLHEYSVSDLERLQIQCHFGFPVPANFRAFVRAGALALCEFHLYRLPLTAEWIAKDLALGPFRPFVVTLLDPAMRLYLRRRVSQNSIPKIKFQVVDVFGSPVDGLFESVAHRFGVCCTRDVEYLNWRFAKNPFNESTLIEWHDNAALVGYAVLDMRSEHCHVIDFLSQGDEKIVLGCFASLVRFVIETGKNSIYLSLNPRCEYASLFKRIGFMQRGIDKRLMVLKNHDQQQDKLFDDPDNWFLMPGDDDST